MSLEKTQVAELPEREREAQEREKAPSSVSQGETSRRVESVGLASVFDAHNRSFFERMSDKGRDIVRQLYESVLRLPKVDLLFGKLQVSYNQFWSDRYQKQVVDKKEEIDRLNSQITALEKSKGDTALLIEDFKSQNLPGVASLQLKMIEVDRQIADLLNKRDSAQSQFEEVENAMKLFTNERDLAASRVIERYKEKLKPMELELDRLKLMNDENDLLISVTRAKHKITQARLEDVEKKQAKLVENLRWMGMSEKEIKKFEAIRELDDLLASGREKMRIEMENLARRKAEINKQIAELDAEANPYRDKIEEFKRVKEGRPISVKVPERKRSAEFQGEEIIETHPRGEDRGEAVSASSIKVESRVAESRKDSLEVVSYLNEWNAFLKETYKEKAELIDAKDFLRVTQLPENYKLPFGDFEDILAKYLKFRRLPTEQFRNSIDEFFEKKNVQV